jgi:hypothetical protein
MVTAAGVTVLGGKRMPDSAGQRFPLTGTVEGELIRKEVADREAVISLTFV